MTPEAKVKAAIKATLNKHGAWWCMPIGTQFGKAGVPDFLCLFNGVFFAVEAKAGNNKATKLQEMEMAAIRNAGGHAMTINETNIDSLESFLRGLAHG